MNSKAHLVHPPLPATQEGLKVGEVEEDANSIFAGFAKDEIDSPECLCKQAEQYFVNTNKISYMTRIKCQGDLAAHCFVVDS